MVCTPHFKNGIQVLSVPSKTTPILIKEHLTVMHIDLSHVHWASTAGPHCVTWAIWWPAIGTNVAVRVTGFLAQPT